MSPLQRIAQLSGHEIIFQTMPLGLIWHDSTGSVVHANPAALRILDLSQAELRQRHPTDPRWRVTSDDGTPLSSDEFPVMVALRTGRLVRNVTVRLGSTSNGEERVLCVTAVPVVPPDSDAPSQVYTIFEDLTERSAADRHRHDTESLFAAVVEHTPDPVFIKDARGRYRLANPAAARILGHPPNEVVGRTNAELLGAPNAKHLDETDTRALRGETVNDDVEWQPTGQTFNLVKFPHRDHKGKIIGVVGLARDVTVLKRLERQLHEVHKLEAMGRLAGGIAHDFNNLLVVIGGSAALLEEQIADHPEVVDEIRELRAAADRAASLTAQLLLLSRRRPVAVQSIDVADSLRNLYQLLRRIVGEQIKLQFNLDTPLPPVKIDPGHFEQIVLNLVVNAKDAMPQGGTLYLSAKAVRSGDEAPATDALPNAAHIVVRDTGSGIPAEVLPHIFEPFFTTKGDKGTGLGLATSYSLTHQYGGTILVDSADSRGSTFTIQLPLSTEAVRATHKNLKNPTGVEKILLVEDEPAVRRLSETILKRRGYDVIAAAGVEEAVALASDQRDLDLVVTDLVLPDGSGAGLAQRLHDDHPSVRVLFMSGHGEEEVVRFGGNEDVPFIQKPFTPSELARCGRSVLDDTAGHSESRERTGRGDSSQPRGRAEPPERKGRGDDPPREPRQPPRRSDY